MIWLLLACAKVPSLDPAATDWPAVTWSPDGRLLVDGRLLDPGTGEWTRLADDWPAFSPSGARIAWQDVGLLHWGETGGVSHIVDTERFLAGEPTLVVGWLDDERLYVHAFHPALVYQSDSDGAIALSCGVWNVATEGWDPLSDCLRGDLSELHQVDLRDGLAIVGSHGEGHPGLNVVGWTPETGASDVGFPALDLYPFGPVDATHRQGAIDLLTPCRLEDGGRPCQREDGEDRTDEPWRHYRWTRDGGLSLVREGLPRLASVDPTSERYAWPTADAVCVGDPASRATTTCHPVR